MEDGGFNWAHYDAERDADRAAHLAEVRAAPLKAPEYVDPELAALFRLLNERERQIILARIAGVGSQFLAEYFDYVEDNRIRQIQNRALALMRHVAQQDCGGYISPEIEMLLLRTFGFRAWDKALDPKPRPRAMGKKPA